MDGALGKGSKLDPFRAYLHQRWNEGVTDAAVLHCELRQRGFAGSVRTVRRHLAPFRGAAAAPDPVPAVPKARQITRWLLSRPEHLQPGEQASLNAIRASCPHTGVLAGRISSFAEMMTARTGDRDLEAWLTAVEADDGQPELRSFATGIRHDQQAVTNGLTLPHSSGKVEGTVNKIKMLNGKCTGAPDSACSAPASSFTQRDHKIRGRTDPNRRRQRSPGTRGSARARAIQSGRAGRQGASAGCVRWWAA
jgi:transposase